MCGRFERHGELGEFARLIQEPVMGDEALFRPDGNIFPATMQPVFRREADGGIHAAGCRWGLVPSWVSDARYGKPINARIETAVEKPMFRAAIRQRRCLIPCNGFYEWQKLPGVGKQPFYITLAGGAPFFLAGIWEENRKLQPEPLESFAILTTDANGIIAPIHDRMPAALPQDLLSKWLNADCDHRKLLVEIATAAERTNFETRAIDKVGN